MGFACFVFFVCFVVVYFSVGFLQSLFGFVWGFVVCFCGFVLCFCFGFVGLFFKIKISG